MVYRAVAGEIIIRLAVMRLGVSPTPVGESSCSPGRGPSSPCPFLLISPFRLLFRPPCGELSTAECRWSPASSAPPSAPLMPSAFRLFRRVTRPRAESTPRTEPSTMSGRPGRVRVPCISVLARPPLDLNGLAPGDPVPLPSSAAPCLSSTSSGPCTAAGGPSGSKSWLPTVSDLSLCPGSWGPPLGLECPSSSAGDGL